MSKRARISVVLATLSLIGATAFVLTQRRPTADTIAGCASFTTQDGRQQFEHAGQNPSASMWLNLNETATVTLDSIDIDAPAIDIPELTDYKDSDLELVIQEFNVPDPKQFVLKPGDKAPNVRAGKNGSATQASVSLRHVPRPGSYTIAVSCDRPVDTDGKPFKASLTLDFFHISLTSDTGTRLTTYDSAATIAAKQQAQPDGNGAIITTVDARIDGLTPKNYNRLKAYFQNGILGVFANSFCNREDLVVSADGASSAESSDFVGYYTTSSARGFRWTMTPDAFEHELFDVQRDADDKVISVLSKKKRFTLAKSSPLTVRDFQVAVRYTNQAGNAATSDTIYLRSTPPDSAILKVALTGVPQEPVFVGGSEVKPIALQFTAQNRTIKSTSISRFAPGVSLYAGTMTPESVTGSSPLTFSGFGTIVGSISLSVNGYYGYKSPGGSGQIDNCQRSWSTASFNTYKFSVPTKNVDDSALPPKITAGDEAGTKLEFVVDGWDKAQNADQTLTRTEQGYPTDTKPLYVEGNVAAFPYRQRFKDYFAGQDLAVGIVDGSGKLIPGYEFSLDQQNWKKTSGAQFASLGKVATGQWSETKASQAIYARNLGAAVVADEKLRVMLPQAAGVFQDFPLTVEADQELTLDAKAYNCSSVFETRANPMWSLIGRAQAQAGCDPLDLYMNNGAGYGTSLVLSFPIGANDVGKQFKITLHSQVGTKQLELTKEFGDKEKWYVKLGLFGFKTTVIENGDAVLTFIPSEADIGTKTVAIETRAPDRIAAMLTKPITATIDVQVSKDDLVEKMAKKSLTMRLADTPKIVLTMPSTMQSAGQGVSTAATGILVVGADNKLVAQSEDNEPHYVKHETLHVELPKALEAQITQTDCAKEAKEADPTKRFVLACDLGELVREANGGTDDEAGYTLEPDQAIPLATVQSKEPVADLVVNTKTIEPKDTKLEATSDHQLDQIMPVSIVATGYHGKPVPGAFVDIIDASTYTVSGVEPVSLLVSCSGTHDAIATEAGHRLNDDGKLDDACMKVADKVRLVLAYKNSDANLTFLTAGHQEADIVHGVLDEMTVVKQNADGTTTVPFKKQNDRYVLPIDFAGSTFAALNAWAFPTGSTNERDWREQFVMSSVLWRDLYLAKREVATDEFGGPALSDKLDVRLLPKGFNVSSRFADGSIQLGQSVWQLRAEGAYSPHTELHEFGHWVLARMGIDTPGSDFRTIGVPDPGVRLDVPGYTQGLTNNCVDVSRIMIQDYFNLKNGRSADFSEANNVCEFGIGGRVGKINNYVGAVNPANAKYKEFEAGPDEPGFLEHIDRSLALGAPVIFNTTVSSSAAGNHTVVITGFDKEKQVYLINNPGNGDKGVGYMYTPDKALTPSYLKSIAHPSGEYAGYGYYDGPQVPGTSKKSAAQTISFQGLNALNAGYLNQSTESSFVEGFANFLALELDHRLGLMNQAGCEWCYRNERNDFLNNFNLINPSFVTFDNRGATGNTMNGESWVVASLFRSLVNGLPSEANAIGGMSVPYNRAWLKSPTLNQRAVTWTPVSLPSVLANLGGSKTIAQLRDKLPAGSPVELTKTAGGTIATTQLDLVLGLYGFFPNVKTVDTNKAAYWQLDAEDFGSNGKLGTSSRENGKTVAVRAYSYSDPKKTQASYAPYRPVPTKILRGTTSSKAGTVSVLNRGSAVDFLGYLPTDVPRNEPEEEVGSQLLVRSTEPALTMLVNVLINDPANEFSFNYQQTITPGQPITLQLPYQTYGSTAVIRFEGSADWLTIDSDQYWQLLDADAPAEIMAEKVVTLGGAMPSVDAVLAAQGYAKDGRRLPPDEPQVTTNGPTDTPVVAVDESPAPEPPSTIEEPAATLVTVTMSESGERETEPAPSNVVEAGTAVTVAVEGLHGKTATVSIDGTVVSTNPVVGDAQQLAVPVPETLGSHTITITDEAGTSLEVPIVVASARHQFTQWLLIGLVSILVAVVLVWLIVRRRRLTPVLPDPTVSQAVTIDTEREDWQ